MQPLINRHVGSVETNSIQRKKSSGDFEFSVSIGAGILQGDYQTEKLVLVSRVQIVCEAAQNVDWQPTGVKKDAVKIRASFVFRIRESLEYY
jgi:hypothetical protein